MSAQRVKPRGKKKRWLVILDIDGTLCLRKTKKDRDEKPETPCDFKTKRYKAWNRPHVREFVQQLLDDNFCVATWTSAERKNAEPLVKAILGDLASKLSLRAYRDQCSIDKEGANHWDTEKVVSQLLTNYPKFQESKTIIVDDSRRKLRKNHESLCIIIESYSTINENIDFPTDDTLLRTIPRILQVRKENPNLIIPSKSFGYFSSASGKAFLVGFTSFLVLAALWINK